MCSSDLVRIPLDGQQSSFLVKNQLAAPDGTIRADGTRHLCPMIFHFYCGGVLTHALPARAVRAVADLADKGPLLQLPRVKKH